MIKSSENKYKVLKYGPITKRRNYSVTKYDLPVSDLIAIQKSSYKRFLEKGLNEVFRTIYPIESTNGRIRIEFVPKSIRIEKPKKEFEAIKEAKKKGSTYSLKVYAKLQKIDEETAEVEEAELLFGEIPLMTKGGTFIVNGSEKIVVSQLLRSPGAYYGIGVRTSKSSDGELYNRLEIIPKLGIWIDVSHRVTGVSTDFVKVSMDKNKTFSLSIFLRALGFSKDTIKNLFGIHPVLLESLKKDNKATEDDALEYVHEITKKGDRITSESKRNFFASYLFNPRRYNIAKTGRYTLNRKLNLIDRLNGVILGEDLKTTSGKVLYKAGTKINLKLAKEIQKLFHDEVLPLEIIPDVGYEIYGNLVDKHPVLKKRTKIIVVNVYKSDRDFKEKKNKIKVIANDPHSTEVHLLISDIVAAISYYFNLLEDIGQDDDLDSLMNKRIVSIGELLQNQFQIALAKAEKIAKERMSSRASDKISPRNITNNKAIYNQFKTFFNSSQLSQFMDQINPLAETANKRRITSLGPGGLNRETANFEVRDVHATHYGRICPIETPEGQNIGLILNFANYAKINEYGFITTPYYPVKNNIVIPKPVYLTAFEEIGLTFAQSSVSLDDEGRILDKKLIARKNFDYILVSPNEVDYIDVSPKQMSSLASSAIPFLENDDANRALMGANMQRQAVPLITSEAPLVATGVEADVARWSAANLKAEEPGKVTYIDSEIIRVKSAKTGKIKTYTLRIFEKSNQDSVITQKPIVKVGQNVKTNEILTDGPCFDKGELALGRNVLVAFATWRGYNFEDAIVLSERLVKEDIYTSIHIEEQIIEFRKSKAGDDELTSEIPNVSNFAKRNLNELGIVRIGSEVVPGDVLVGRVSPKGEENPTPEEKLISSIFVKKSKNVKDTSLKVKHGHGGTVIDVQVLSREDGDKLQDAVETIIRVYIAQKRKIKPGDKMAGRHGNKGVISIVLPVEDMPHLADGTPMDILLNPQGVPSRMNIGQVLELHLGMAAKALGVKFVSPVFDGIKYQQINQILEEAKLPKDGKFDLYDGITGKKFDHRVSVGYMYMMKLVHMVDDKMHARSVGPYSLITQQPLGGKSQNGGQRFGEMETWALESFGAANVLQELLTYKSDNISGRNKVYNALANGNPLPPAGTPESFNVLAYELRGLGLKLTVNVNDENPDNKKGRGK